MLSFFFFCVCFLLLLLFPPFLHCVMISVALHSHPILCSKIPKVLGIFWVLVVLKGRFSKVYMMKISLPLQTALVLLTYLQDDCDGRGIKIQMKLVCSW